MNIKMYTKIIGTKYETLFCGCGRKKKLAAKYCMWCSNKLNLLRAKVRGARDITIKENNRKELESFIKIYHL